MLPLALSRIFVPEHQRSGEIPDSVDAMGREIYLAQLGEVEPTIRRVFQATVIEVKPVDVYVCDH